MRVLDVIFRGRRFTAVTAAQRGGGRGVMVRSRVVVFALCVAASVVFAGRLPLPVGAATEPVALQGTVRSMEEGAMEGVVVSARMKGAPFYVSVVSDEKGRYAFPRRYLAPGTYVLTMRATGYDLTDPGLVDVSAKRVVMRDLALVTAQDLSSQLSSREWAHSMPGSDEVKRKLIMAGLSCTYCHSLERIVKSRHTAEQFVAVITRMQRYFEDGTAVPSGTGRGRSAPREKERLAGIEQSPTWYRDITKAELAAFLASVNLGGGRSTFPYPLKQMPRPKGIATRAIVTTWEIPRKDAVAHDSEVDSKGRVWYSEENSWLVGMLDPKTNAFTEYPIEPAMKDRAPETAGSRDLLVDKQDKLWLPLRTGPSTLLHRFDPVTQTLTRVEGAEGGAIFGGVDPDGQHVWIGPVRADARTAKVDGDFRRPTNIEPGRRLSNYGFGVNSKGNPYGTDPGGSRLWGVDVRTNTITYWPLAPNVFPRRSRMDAQDRFWVGLYGGDGIAMLDTRTGILTQWRVPVPFTTPYNATVPDKDGFIYSASNTAERILRLNPRTGEVIEFPMPNGPGNFDAKKMAFDPTSKKTVLLFSNIRNAEIMRVEMPD